MNEAKNLETQCKAIFADNIRTRMRHANHNSTPRQRLNTRVSGICITNLTSKDTIFMDHVHVYSYMNDKVKIECALPNSTTDPNAIPQFTSANLFVRVGQNVTSQTLPYILCGNTTLILTTEPNGTSLARGSDYSVADDNIIFSASFLRAYFNPSDSPGSIANLTLEFSTGADLTLNLLTWDTPVLGSTSSSAAAANGSSISIPLQWKGTNKSAAVKAMTRNGTYLVDNCTKYYGHLQNARMTYNFHWKWDATI